LKKIKKLNEVAIFESFRIQPSKNEKIEVERLKKKFKESPISTTGSMILESIGVLFAPGWNYIDYYKKTYSNIATVFKSSIRDAALSDVSQILKKKKKKAYEIKKTDLEKMILKEEKRIKEKREVSLIKKILFIHLGIPFL
jgi:hypothetical protein